MIETLFNVMLRKIDKIKTKIMSNKLLKLKNIGNTSALWLQSIGILNYEQLQNIGAVEAYVKIQERGIKTSVVLLYALQGALIDTHWNELTEEQKQWLRQQVDSYKKLREKQLDKI